MSFPGGHRAWFFTGIFAMLQESVEDQSEEKEQLCLIQWVWNIPTSPVGRGSVNLGWRQESGEDFHREISNIWLFFLICRRKKSV